MADNGLYVSYALKWSAEKCASTMRNMKNIIDQIRDRLSKLEGNPRGLPFDKPGAKPWETIKGHWGIVKDLLATLALHAADYAVNCGSLPTWLQAALEELGLRAIQPLIIPQEILDNIDCILKNTFRGRPVDSMCIDQILTITISGRK